MTTLDTRYLGASGVETSLDIARLGLSTNSLREATFFKGELRDPILLREGLGAVHRIVTSDFRYRPKDRLAWKLWLAEQDRLFVRSLKSKSHEAKAQLEQIELRLHALDKLRSVRMTPFYAARARYADYVVDHAWETAYLFDPVVTVHPDEVFFEAFSRDESSYVRLSAKRELWSDIGAVEFGTTNIDFSAGLARQLDRLRTYRQTTFDVSPGGVSVAVDGAVHKENKIELPETWVQGFLQVQATTTLGLRSFAVAPIDLFNLIRALTKKKTRASPRALRWELTPGARVAAVLEPWGDRYEMGMVYDGPSPVAIRTWGRDRLKVLERLLPVAKRCRVYLAGFGLPSFYVLDLGPVVVTLGLSGWTDNDWSGTRFELLSRPADATAAEMMTVYTRLRDVRVATDDALVVTTGLSIDKVRSALSALCQLGRATHDLAGDAYRHRDLFADAFTLAEAKKVAGPPPDDKSPQGKAARTIFEADGVRIIARRPVASGFKLSGSVRDVLQNGVFRPQLHIGPEGEIIEGLCTCRFYSEHKLTRGPCEHLLALRLAHAARGDT